MQLFPTIYSVTCHTGHVGPGSTFVAIKGYNSNGLDFIDQAIEHGAIKIIVEKTDEASITQKAGIEYIFVDDARIALAEHASAELCHPSRQLKIIGVTGTKGKTTTTFMVEHILRSAGYKTALLGGVYNKIGNHEEASPLTTLGADDLHMFFGQCVKAEVDYVVMEASSHAASLKRLHGIEFEAFGFTNFGQDHLDFYGTMQNYFEAKLSLINHLKAGHTLVTNADHEWSGKIAEYLTQSNLRTKLNIISIERDKNFTLVSDGFDGLEVKITTDDHTTNFKSPMIAGTFNAYNLVMAAQLAHAVGIESDQASTRMKLSWQTIAQALSNFTGTPGRLQQHRLANGARAFVDFAHNPSSFEAVLSTLRPLTQHLIVLFGCGGNRDTTKRPLMGALAAQFGDLVIITDDNPRNEDRMDIINDIVQGIAPEDLSKIIIEANRTEAVQKAVAAARPESIIALLGKGHEQYYLIAGQKIIYNDFKEISRY